MKNNLSSKISIILVAISITTILILTVLMHFRYHLTRTELINDRLQVTSNAIANIIDTKIKSGLMLPEQVDLIDYIKKSKKREIIIENIHVLNFNGKKIGGLYKTSDEDLSSIINEKCLQKMRISKTNMWSFSELNGNLHTNFFGVTIKNPSGGLTGAIVVSYNGGALAKAEAQEVNALYLRFAIASALILIISLLISKSVTQSIKMSLDSILKSLSDLKEKKTDFNITDIDDPGLKRDLRMVLKNTSHIQTSLKKVDELLISAMEEENHEHR